MTDDLKQLLHNADQVATAPSITLPELVQRVQRTARRDRCVAACGLAILLLSLTIAPLVFRRQHHPEIANIKTTNLKSEISDPLDAAVHEKTVALIESMRRAPRKS